MKSFFITLPITVLLVLFFLLIFNCFSQSTQDVLCAVDAKDKNNYVEQKIDRSSEIIDLNNVPELPGNNYKLFFDDTCDDELLDLVCLSYSRKYSRTYLISAQGPAHGAVNETVSIDVSFGVSNGCWSFGKFSEHNSGYNKIIKVFAKFEGSPCTQALNMVHAVYSFIPKERGIYTIKFAQPDTLTCIINIQ